MKIAVLGGTGLFGSRVAGILAEEGHEAVPHSLSTGVDLRTGRGLAGALAGADVAVDVTSPPAFDEASVAFLAAGTRNLLAAATDAGLGHAVVLSVVGADRVPGLAYYRAKARQEDLLGAGPVPYSIVRTTQFFEFLDTVMSWTSDRDTVRLPATPVQPVAEEDAARAVAEVCAGPPLRDAREVAGPTVFALDELGRIALASYGDGRTVVTDDTAGVYAAVPGGALLPGDGAVIATTEYRLWLGGSW